MADANVCGEKRQCTARTDAVHCKDGCSALRGRMQCTAGTVAVHYGSGCSALRERLQCTASEMGKTGTEIASPILDKRTRRRDAPVAPWKYLLYLHLGISPHSPLILYVLDMMWHIDIKKAALGGRTASIIVPAIAKGKLLC